MEKAATAKVIVDKQGVKAQLAADDMALWDLAPLDALCSGEASPGTVVQHCDDARAMRVMREMVTCIEGADGAVRVHAVACMEDALSEDKAMKLSARSQRKVRAACKTCRVHVSSGCTLSGVLMKPVTMLIPFRVKCLCSHSDTQLQMLEAARKHARSSSGVVRQRLRHLERASGVPSAGAPHEATSGGAAVAALVDDDGGAEWDSDDHFDLGFESKALPVAAWRARPALAASIAAPTLARPASPAQQALTACNAVPALAGAASTAQQAPAASSVAPKPARTASPAPQAEDRQAVAKQLAEAHLAGSDKTLAEWPLQKAATPACPTKVSSRAAPVLGARVASQSVEPSAGALAQGPSNALAHPHSAQRAYELGSRVQWTRDLQPARRSCSAEKAVAQLARAQAVAQPPQPLCDTANEPVAACSEAVAPQLRSDLARLVQHLGDAERSQGSKLRSAPAHADGPSDGPCAASGSSTSKRLREASATQRAAEYLRPEQKRRAVGASTDGAGAQRIEPNGASPGRDAAMPASLGAAGRTGVPDPGIAAGAARTSHFDATRAAVTQPRQEWRHEDAERAADQRGSPAQVRRHLKSAIIDLTEDV